MAKKPFSKKQKTFVAAIALIAVAATLLIWYFFSARYLCIRNEDTGESLFKLPVSDGYTFSVSFIHSVNKSDVEEVYQVRGGDIYLTGCIYRAFGAGVADVLDPAWTLEYDAQGNMVLGNINRKLPRLSYIVGTVYDHMLHLPDKVINLREAAGKNATVSFQIVNGFGTAVAN